LFEKPKILLQERCLKRRKPSALIWRAPLSTQRALRQRFVDELAQYSGYSCAGRGLARTKVHADAMISRPESSAPVCCNISAYRVRGQMRSM
jgi:hypothetical protein